MVKSKNLYDIEKKEVLGYIHLEHVNKECLKFLDDGAKKTKERKDLFKRKVILLIHSHPEILNNNEFKDNISLLYPGIFEEKKEYLSMDKEKKKDVIFRRLYLEGVKIHKNKGLNSSQIIRNQINLHKNRLGISYYDDDTFIGMLIDGKISLDITRVKRNCSKRQEIEALKDLLILFKDLIKIYRTIVKMVNEDIDTYDNFMSKEDIKPNLFDFKKKIMEIIADLKLIRHPDLIYPDIIHDNYVKIRELFTTIKFNKVLFDELSNKLYRDIDANLEKIKTLI